MLTDLAFVDTETTSLRPDRRVWEVAIIWPDTLEPRLHRFIDRRDLDLGNADLKALEVGSYYTRHPSNQTHSDMDFLLLGSEREVMHEVEEWTRGRHLVSATSFDAEGLAARMRANGLCPSWNYHVIEIESFMIGYLAANGVRVERPWKSVDLAKLVGVDPLPADQRHTAVGDAMWVKDIYTKLTSGT